MDVPLVPTLELTDDLAGVRIGVLVEVEAEVEVEVEVVADPDPGSPPAGAIARVVGGWVD